MATETPTYKWISPKGGHSAHRGLYELLRREAPEDQVKALFDRLTAIRGAHRVEIRRSTWSIGGEHPHRVLTFRGTELAQAWALLEIDKALGLGLIEISRNADHDHRRCIADAAAQGVPAPWAHQVETYLSM